MMPLKPPVGYGDALEISDQTVSHSTPGNSSASVSAINRFAVVGQPVAHSLSPQIHQAFAAQCRHTLDYQRLPVDAEHFNAFVQDFFKQGGQGLNITLPFKTQAYELAQVHTERAHTAGAVNTLFMQGGLLHGHNTDGDGLIQDLKRLGAIGAIGTSGAGRRIVLIGAGGAARGVLRPLLETAPEVLLIVNRSADKAAALLTGVTPYRGTTELLSGELNAWPIDRIDLVINATSSSLQGIRLALPAKAFAAHAWAYDMMYAATPTAFLETVSACGITQRSDGLGMLIEQAAQSYLCWHGVMPDTLPLHRELRIQLQA